MANPWEMNWGGGDPGGPVIAPPDPYKQAGEQRAQRDQALQEQTTALSNQLTEMQIREKQAKLEEERAAQAAASEADKNARDKLMRVITNMSEVGVDVTDNSFSPGLGETGTSGRFMRSIPGSNAGKDLDADIKNLSANFAFDALQAMRDASKTGGALGQVSERELDLLESATANVSPDQSQENFTKNLGKARQAYLAKLAMIDPEAAAELGYDPAKAEQAMREMADAYAKSLGTTAETEVLNERQASGGWGKAQVVD